MTEPGPSNTRSPRVRLLTASSMARLRDCEALRWLRRDRSDGDGDGHLSSRGNGNCDRHCRLCLRLRQALRESRTSNRRRLLAVVVPACSSHRCSSSHRGVGLRIYGVRIFGIRLQALAAQAEALHSSLGRARLVAFLGRYLYPFASPSYFLIILLLALDTFTFVHSVTPPIWRTSDGRCAKTGAQLQLDPQKSAF